MRLSSSFARLWRELPENTLCVYSFSKYFGATGWRLAVVALHEENIYDRMLKELPAERKEQLNERYSSISLHPEEIRFIDRMVADSRQVALKPYRRSFAAATDANSICLLLLLDSENAYKAKMQQIIHDRLHTLWESTGFTLLDDPVACRLL